MLPVVKPILAEQPGQQRNKGDANEGDTAARHKLFHALAFRARIIVAVTFQQIDSAPDAKTGSESNNEGLKDPNSRVEKCHVDSAGIMGSVGL